MERIKLVTHAPGAPGLRFLGLGPDLTPMKGMLELQNLLETHSFWAKKRSVKNLRILLSQSTAAVSLWKEKRMVGFGRATSDGIYRAVLWDVVVAGDLQGVGLGRQVVEALMECKSLNNVEKIYLMTTQGADFYKQIGFKEASSQKLLLKEFKEF